MSINSKLISLRKIRIEDASLLMELNNNQDIAKFVVGNPILVNMDQELKWIKNLKNEKKTIRKIIDYKNNSIGTIIFTNLDLENQTSNINIKLLPDFQGKGLAKQAIIEACSIGFSEINLYCITANILEYNIKSQNLFESVGFHRDGILRKRVVKNKKRYDLFTYSILKEEFLKRDLI